MPSQEKVDQARGIFQDHGGTMRTGEALAAGVDPRTLYAMRDSGVLERLARGLYRLSDAPPLEAPDLVTVAMKVPQAVVCLVSALAFHQLTRQIPHVVQIAVKKHGKFPRLQSPPIEVFEFGGKAFNEGIESHDIDAVKVRVYSPEKTIADCFKYRGKIGQDVAVEGLRAYVERGGLRIQQLMSHARTCRVARVLRPYLEALV